MQDIIQPPAGSSLEQDEQDPDPFPEDEEFLKYQTQRARKRLSTSFWMVWRVRNAMVSKTCTYFLTASLCQ
jgi:hypothetical protein